MSKTCEYCGMAIPDDSNICESCGTVQNADEEPRGKLKIKFSVPKLIFCLIAVAALVGLVFIASDLNRDIYEGGGFESALDNTADYYNGNVAKMKSFAPKEYWKRAEEANGSFSIDEYIAALESAVETSEEKQTARYSYRIEKEEHLSRKETEALDKEVMSVCGVEEGRLVTDAYYVECLFTVKDGEDVSTHEHHVTIVRIRDNWYVFDKEDKDFGIVIGSDR